MSHSSRRSAKAWAALLLQEIYCAKEALRAHHILAIRITLVRNHNRLPEWQIRRFKFRTTCVRERRAPCACRTGMHQRNRRVNDNPR